MPDRTTQTEIEKVESLLRMIEGDGVSSSGSLPPTEYIAALLDAEDLQRPQEIAESHKNGKKP